MKIDDIKTPEQLKAYSDYIQATIDFHRKVTPQYIRINEKYLNTFLNNPNVTQFTWDSVGNMDVDYKGVIPFSGIQVVIDNSIETYEFVYNT